MSLIVPLPDCPPGLDVTAPVHLGPAMLVIRVRGPMRGGCPHISWQGGRGVDHSEYQRLRLTVALISAARELDDVRAVQALALYPVAQLVLDAAADAIRREAGLARAIDLARERQAKGVSA